MYSHGVMLRAAALTGVLVGLVSLFFMVVRPWYMGWGATAAERVRTLPGDALVPGAPEQETRAITVQAPAERVCPWVAQLGQDRGGFYSYEILEDLVGCEMENLHHLDPTLQHWQVGDKLWMYPPHKLGGIGHATLAILEPGRTLVFATRQIGTPLSAPPDGTWAFVIESIDTSASRLLVRGRAAGGLSLFGTAFDWAIFEPAHFAMERKMLESIKVHAEGQTVSDTADTVQVLLWCLTFVAFVASAVLVLAGRQWPWRLLTFAIAGLLFQLLTLVQLALVVGAPCVAVLWLGVWAPRRRMARRAPSGMDARAQSMLRRRQRPPPVAVSLHHGLLTPQLAAATAARGTAAPRAASRRAPSVQRPWRASEAATAWPSRCRWWARAAARAGVDWREASTSCRTSDREPAAVATHPHSCTAC